MTLIYWQKSLFFCFTSKYVPIYDKFEQNKNVIDTLFIYKFNTKNTYSGFLLLRGLQ